MNDNTENEYPEPQVGERCGAFVSADGKVVQFLGFGTRVEDSPASRAYINGKLLTDLEDFSAWMTVEAEKAGHGHVPELLMMMAHSRYMQDMNVPTIKLDNGETVWGSECYWGSVPAIQTFLDELEVKHVVFVRDETGEAIDTREVKPVAAAA